MNVALAATKRRSRRMFSQPYGPSVMVPEWRKCSSKADTLLMPSRSIVDQIHAIGEAPLRDGMVPVSRRVPNKPRAGVDEDYGNSP